MWLDILLVFLAFVVLDVVTRAFLMVRLGKHIDARGDYRPRHHKIGESGRQFVITLLGASSIYGEGSTVEIPFAGNLVKQAVEQGYTAIVNNLAVSGHKVADVTRKQIPQMKPSDLVIVYAVTKDCLTFTPTRLYVAALRQLTQVLEGQKIIWVTIGDPRLLWIFPIWLRWLFYFRARKFTTLLRQVIAEYPEEQWRVADFFVQGSAEAKRHNLKVRQVVSDGIHLSDEGQQIVSGIVSKAYDTL